MTYKDINILSNSYNAPNMRPETCNIKLWGNMRRMYSHEKGKTETLD